jgi:hypothetical protein
MGIGAEEWISSRKGNMFEIRRGRCDPVEAYLLVGNRARDFSLRLQRPHGEEIMSLHFTIEIHQKWPFRKVAATLFAPGVMQRLESVRPDRGPLSGWCLNLGNRFAIPSKKNARLEGENAGPIYIRKYRKGGLEVQTTDSRMSPLCLFGLCIGSFIARN